jgi:pimeloyl-ACP methyl ester carboxylesterase
MVTDGKAHFNGLDFHFLDWGTAGLPHLLLLHGAAQSAHSWDEVAPDLAGDHHVVALDQRGHGDSGWARDGAYAREHFVGDVRAFLDDRKWSRVTLMGLSLGGLNAIAFTLAHPDAVRALIVVDVTPSVERTGVDGIRAQLAVREFVSIEDAVARAHAFNPRRSLENIRSRMRHGLRRMSDGRWVYKFDPAIAAAEGGADLEVLWARLREIRCPTLLVRGADSPILSKRSGERFAAEIAGSEVVEVAGAGHSVMGDNPTGFLEAVRPFLARHRL